MTHELAPALRPDFFGQLAATDPHQGRARRLFERGQVVGVNGNQANLLVGYDARNNPLELKQVPIISGYVPRMGDWVSIQYEAGHSGAPWVTGPSMAADERGDSAGIGVFSVGSSAPLNPSESTVYFDTSRATWRGWDGEDWVDFSAKLHNNLSDVQGGEPGAYYHFTDVEYGMLKALQDGSGMNSAWVKQLKFQSIGTMPTSRTRLIEKDGDFFWTINAEYDEAEDHWNRIDTSEYSYLIACHSKNSIPTEPIGGLVWWRAVPGSNPIGDWASVGGWELGFMMTEHRNYVMGGMNLEMDGSGAPPYGRLTHVGADDASGTIVTAIQRNSWYEGGGQWGRDCHDEHSGIAGFDAGGDFFVSWYPDSSRGSAPWDTSAWHERGRFHLGQDGIQGRFDVIRTSNETAAPGSAFFSKHRTSGDMVDGFGAGYALAIEDNAGVENIIGAMYALRSGTDNTGELSWHVARNGALAERMSLSADGNLTVEQLIIDGGNIGPSGDTDLMKLTSGRVQVYNNGADAELMIHEDADTHAAYIHIRRGAGDWNIGMMTSRALDFTYEGNAVASFYHVSPYDLTLNGSIRVDGGDIGLSGDTDLLQLAANSLTVNGAVHMPSIKTGISQANAGAAAGELWADTNDDYTVKLGV